MKKISIDKRQVSQNAFVTYKAYKRAIELINEFNGTITSKPKKPIVALFKSNKQAQKFIDQFELEYTAAHEAYEATKVAKDVIPQAIFDQAFVDEYASDDIFFEDEPKKAKPEKTKSSPKKTKGNGKMSLNDFVVSKPNCSRKEAEAFGFKGTREDLRVLKRTLGVR